MVCRHFHQQKIPDTKLHCRLKDHYTPLQLFLAVVPAAKLFIQNEAGGVNVNQIGFMLSRNALMYLLVQCVFPNPLNQLQC